MRRLVLGIAIAAAACAPAVGQADDQRIAEFIKSRLQTEQHAGNLRGFNIDMRVEQGTVWFTGHVADESMEMLVLKAGQAAGHLGAVQVVDEIEVKASAQTPAMPAVVQASEAAMPLAPMAQPSMMVNYQEPIGQQQVPGNIPLGTPVQGVPMQGIPGQGMPGQGFPGQGIPMSAYQGGPSYQGATGPMMQPGPGMMQASGPMMQASAPMPLPMGSAAGQDMSAMAGGQPNMPGYAWPGYAAYPNYGAVSYPTQYSPSAWPYIGPFYPYPQVPLGWRKVALEWDDGWWYLDFHDR
jgi:hypothetical protein